MTRSYSAISTSRTPAGHGERDILSPRRRGNLDRDGQARVRLSAPQHRGRPSGHVVRHGVAEGAWVVPSFPRGSFRIRGAQNHVEIAQEAEQLRAVEVPIRPAGLQAREVCAVRRETVQPGG